MHHIPISVIFPCIYLQICDLSLYYIHRSVIFPSITSTDPQICDLSLCYIYRSVISPSVTSTDLWSFLVLHPQICDISLYYNQRSYDLILYYIYRSVIFPCITIKDHMILSCITSADLWSFHVFYPQICDISLYNQRSVILSCITSQIYDYYFNISYFSIMYRYVLVLDEKAGFNIFMRIRAE